MPWAWKFVARRLSATSLLSWRLKHWAQSKKRLLAFAAAALLLPGVGIGNANAWIQMAWAKMAWARIAWAKTATGVRVCACVCMRVPVCVCVRVCV